MLTFAFIPSVSRLEIRTEYLYDFVTIAICFSPRICKGVVGQTQGVLLEWFTFSVSASVDSLVCPSTYEDFLTTQVLSSNHEQALL